MAARSVIARRAAPTTASAPTPDVDVRAEMVAQVHSVLVEPGAVIAIGDTLVILESMKMEKSEGMKMRGGGMAMRKGYADGGMPMVMKDGKKVPSFAADGRGKMKHGGMAHDAKAKKGRGMAIMIAIGKPKGRGKS